MTDDAGFFALEGAWRVLHQRAGAPVFAGWNWLAAWWAQFGNGRPVVALLGSEDAPLGALALYRYAGDGVTRLLPIGAGISDYFDALLHPEAPPDAASRLLRAALGAADVSRAELLEVAPGAALRAAAADGWRLVWGAGAPCPVLDLCGAALEDAIPAKAAQKWRMNANRCARMGAVEVRHGADPAEVLALLTRFGAARREDNVLDDARVREMLGRAVPGMAAEPAILRIGGVAAAAILAFREPGRICFYLSGFDPAFAQASPGSVLLGHMLRHAQGECAEAHFLRGDEAYKLAWGAVVRRNATGVLTRDAA